MARVYYTSSGTVPANIDTLDGYISDYVVFSKGITPPPLKLKQNPESGVIQVIFEKTPMSSCICSIQCQSAPTVQPPPTVSEPDPLPEPFCPETTEYTSTLTDQIFADNAPTSLLFEFEDAYGNTSGVSVDSIITVVPKAPTVTVVGDHIEIDVGVESHDSTDLSGSVIQVQIERYIRNIENREVLVDWTDTPLDTVTDIYVPQDVEVGYRARYRSLYDNSQWSSWTLTVI